MCQNSSPEIGLCFSNEALELLNKIKEFNYKYIYTASVLKASDAYFEMVINTIYSVLKMLMIIKTHLITLQN